MLYSKIENAVDKGKQAVKSFLKAKRDGVPTTQEPELDIVDLSQRVWTAFDEGTTRDDLDKVSTAWAFVEGMQNKYWYQRNMREEILPSDSAEPARNQDSWNLMRDEYMQWAGQIKAGLPIYRCEPTADYDAKQKETARINNTTYKYHYDYVWKADVTAYTHLLPYLYKGPAYLLYYPGKPDNLRAPGKKPSTVVKQLILPAHSVAPMGEYQSSLQECEGVVCELVQPVRVMQEMFPEGADAIHKHVLETDVKHSSKQTRLATYLAEYGIEPAKPNEGFTIYDRELIWGLVIHRPCPRWPNGKMWLVLEKTILASQDLWGGVLPIEVVRVSEKLPGRPVGISPAFEMVTSQIAFNDIFGAMRKKAYADANRDKWTFENTILSADGKSYRNNIEIGDGQTRTLRVNPELVGQGVSPKDQVPFETPASGSGIAPEVLGLARNLLQTGAHVNSEMANMIPRPGIPASAIENVMRAGEQKLTPSQIMLENSIFNAWIIATTVMQATLKDGDLFTIVNAGKVESAAWKKENLVEGLNHTFESNIGKPTTKEGKLKYLQAMLMMFPQLAQTLDAEDLMIFADIDGMLGGRGRNPEIELSEEINRKIQNAEFDKVAVKNGIDKYVVRGYELRPEWNCRLHLKILSQLYVSKIWTGLTAEQRECANGHAGDLMAMQWLKDNKQGGMFGQLPPAEFDAQMWAARGVEIEPETLELMKTLGKTYLEVMADQAAMAQPQVDEKGRPIQPVKPGIPPAITEAAPQQQGV